MSHRDTFWKFEHLSDSQLLESLGAVLRTQRRTLAELIAHLAEVEDRRLHLEAAHSSMFAYCVARLGMSEDEACRRIELARLARRFPALFTELETGQITLSVALVLKPILTADNHRELLCAARCKSTQQARELVAERFPKPDAPSSIRKLPERQPDRAAKPPDLAAGPPPPPDLPLAAGPVFSALPPSVPVRSPPLSVVPAPSLTMPFPSTPPPAPPPALSQPTLASPAIERQPPTPSPPTSRSVIEPLSAERYRIQFTADRGVKEQLERARDLLRHAHPSGDFGPIVSRALDLLLDDLLRRRFGARARRKGPRPTPAEAARTPCRAPTPGERPNTSPSVRASGELAKAPASQAPCAVEPAPEAHSRASPLSQAARSPTSEAGTAPAWPSATPSGPKPRSSRVPRATRRTVLERDGLGCSWVDARGVRCGSLAWLEHDHRQPVGKRGSSEPDNVRLLCRSHNQLAAERAYGREHIERATARRQAATRRAAEQRRAVAEQRQESAEHHRTAEHRRAAE